MNDYDDEPQFHNPSYQNNRLLIEDPDDQFVRSGGGQALGAPNMAPRKNLKPLIEEEKEAPSVSNDDMAYSLGLPALKAKRDQNAARRQYNMLLHNKAAANPWTKTGQQTRKNVNDMFGEGELNESPLKKLFGAPRGNFRAQERQDRRQEELEATGTSRGDGNGGVEHTPAKGISGAFKRFWWRMKNRNAPSKMSWMERLFGARRKKADSAKAMGIKSTNSPMGVSSGWADQLVEAAKTGRLDPEGEKMEPLVSERPSEEKQANAPQSAEHVVDDATSELSEEEKVPQPAGNHKSNEYGGPKQDQDDVNSLEDDPIYQDENEDDDDDVGAKEKEQLMFKNYIMGIFNK